MIFWILHPLLKEIESSFHMDRFSELRDASYKQNILLHGIFPGTSDTHIQVSFHKSIYRYSWSLHNRLHLYFSHNSISLVSFCCKGYSFPYGNTFHICAYDSSESSHISFHIGRHHVPRCISLIFQIFHNYKSPRYPHSHKVDIFQNGRYLDRDEDSKVLSFSHKSIHKNGVQGQHEILDFFLSHKSNNIAAFVHCIQICIEDKTNYRCISFSGCSS